MSEDVQFVDANCDFSRNPCMGPMARDYNLIPAKTTGNITGTWTNIDVIKNFSVHTYGTFGGGSVQLEVSNDNNPTADSDNGIALGSAITTAGMVTYSAPYKWIRAIVTGASGASLNCRLHGVA
jgi:hypothetical protein